jgi:MFS family permease
MTTSRFIDTKLTGRVRGEDTHTPLAAVMAVGGIALFLAGVAVLHVVQRGLNPARHMVSEYALGAYGWIQTADFLAAGVGAIALGFVLARTNREPGRIGPLLIAGFGVSSLVVAFVQADGDGPVTTHGSIHTLVSILGSPPWSPGCSRSLVASAATPHGFRCEPRPWCGPQPPSEPSSWCRSWGIRAGASGSGSSSP